MQELVDNVNASYKILEVENIRCLGYCKQISKVIQYFTGIRFTNSK